jgi:hypothetical protein
MGLFNKATPEEKRIKEIFGGMAGSFEFERRLKEAEIHDYNRVWLKIKKQIKEEVVNEGLTVDKIDERTEELIHECYENQSPEDKLKGKETLKEIRQREAKK